MTPLRSIRGAMHAIVLGFMLLAAAAATVEAAPPVAGGTVTDRLTVAGKHVPLPPGTWEIAVVGTGTIDVSESRRKIDAVALGPILHLVLVQHEAGRVRAMIEVHANAIAHFDGWGTAEECLRDDLYAAVTRYESGWDASCLFVAPATVEDAPDGSVWPALRRHAASRQIELPGLWLVAGFRVSNRHDVVDVRYHFAPDAFGIPAAAADAAAWAPGTISADPLRLQLVKDLAAWAATMQKFVEQGLQNRLAAGPYPAPRTTAVAAVPNERADRQARLKSLLDDGTIDQAEHDRQRRVIDEEVVPKDLSTWTLSQVAAWKGATYRVVVTTINAGIDYIFIGQPFAAGVLVVLQVVVNTTKFFFHEMMWQEWLGVAPLQRTELPVIRFRHAADI